MTPEIINRDEFRTIVTQAVNKHGVQVVADKLRTARGTVTRWMNGHSSPANITRTCAAKLLAEI